MGTIREDERKRQEQKVQGVEKPLLDIGTQAVIGIEESYQKEIVSDAPEESAAVELGNIPNFILGKPIHYIPIRVTDYLPAK